MFHDDDSTVFNIDNIIHSKANQKKVMSNTIQQIQDHVYQGSIMGKNIVIVLIGLNHLLWTAYDVSVNALRMIHEVQLLLMNPDD